MIDLVTLRRLNLEAARNAAQEKKTPLFFYDGDDLATFQDNIPYIGDYLPKGWTRVDIAKELGIPDPENERGFHDGGNAYFVDRTGFGRTYEPALTRREFAALLKAGYGYATVECGPCQEHIAVFQRKPKQ